MPTAKRLAKKPENPLQEAYKIGLRSQKWKFDWDHIQDVRAKVEEEFEEVKNAKNQAELNDEIGDLLFAVAQLARHHKVNPNKALLGANKKFNTRFFKMIEVSGLSQRAFYKLPLAQKEEYWKQVKKILAKKL